MFNTILREDIKWIKYNIDFFENNYIHDPISNNKIESSYSAIYDYYEAHKGFRGPWSLTTLSPARAERVARSAGRFFFWKKENSLLIMSLEELLRSLKSIDESDLSIEDKFNDINIYDEDIKDVLKNVKYSGSYDTVYEVVSKSERVGDFMKACLITKSFHRRIRVSVRNFTSMNVKLEDMIGISFYTILDTIFGMSRRLDINVPNLEIMSPSSLKGSRALRAPMGVGL